MWSNAEKEVACQRGTMINSAITVDGFTYTEMLFYSIMLCHPFYWLSVVLLRILNLFTFKNSGILIHASNPRKWEITALRPKTMARLDPGGDSFSISHVSTPSAT